MNQLTTRDLMKRWRRQIASQVRRRASGQPRSVAALGLLPSIPNPGDFIELDQLALVIVRDEAQPRRPLALRVSGYGARLIPHGVEWGGSGNEKLYKDLSLCPLSRARGQRMDKSNVRLFELALQLERRIFQAYRYGLKPRRHLRLPRCWAALSSEVARDLRGTGPELAQLCRKFGLSEESMFKKFELRLDGMHLFPLNFVSDRLQGARTVLAEMEGFPKTQTIALKHFPEALMGYSGASSYDFFSSRFRLACSGPHSPRSKYGNPASDLGAAVPLQTLADTGVRPTFVGVEQCR